MSSLIEFLGIAAWFAGLMIGDKDVIIIGLMAIVLAKTFSGGGWRL